MFVRTWSFETHASLISSDQIKLCFLPQYSLTMVKIPQDYLQLTYTLLRNQYNSVLIDPTAKIGSDCSIGPNVVIGPSVIIGNGVKLKNTVILPHTRIEHSTDNSKLNYWLAVQDWILVSLSNSYAPKMSVSKMISI